MENSHDVAHLARMNETLIAHMPFSVFYSDYSQTFSGYIEI